MIKCWFSQVWVSTKDVYSTLYAKLFRLIGSISGNKAKLRTPIVSHVKVAAVAPCEVYSSPDLSVPSRTHGEVVGLAVEMEGGCVKRQRLHEY